MCSINLLALIIAKYSQSSISFAESGTFLAENDTKSSSKIHHNIMKDFFILKKREEIKVITISSRPYNIVSSPN